MKSGLHRIVGWFAAGCVVLSLLGCDLIGGEMFKEWRFQKLKAGTAKEAEVVSIMGKPERVWENADSTHTLEYPMGPQGEHTWMVTANKDGLVTVIDQVLNDQQFEQVVSGLDKQAVLRLIGRPRKVITYALSGEEVWDWKYRHYHEIRYFNVHFNPNTGVVLKKSFTEEMKNR